MKQLKVLELSFDIPIKPFNITAFRGAFSQHIGIENDWFHNHNNNKKEKYFSRFHNRYPLIQYKICKIDKKFRPMILCIDKCVEEVHKCFEKENKTLCMNGKEHELRLFDLKLMDINIKVNQSTLHYNILNWQALNERNYKVFKGMESLVEKIQFLEQKLIANILSFAKGIKWTVDKRITVKILELSDPKFIKFKNISVASFDVKFKCNVILPDYLGLGKGASRNFGIIRTL